MRSIITLVALALLSGCMATAPNKPVVAPKTHYSQIGAEVYSPNEAGWLLAQYNTRGVAFGKQYDSTQNTAVANTIIFMVHGFENDSDFLTHIAEQREVKDEKSRFKILIINNEQVRFKNTSCLKYKTISEDHKNSGINSENFQYLKIFGYICRHPSKKSIAFQMEISHRSSEKDFPESLLSIGEEFFSNIKFTDKGLN